jgi:hypothetical protein
MQAVDIDAIRARRDGIEQEITRHREAIAALEQKRSELEIAERVISEFSAEPQTAAAETRQRPRQSAQPKQKRPKGKRQKPGNLPTVPEMITAALRDARERGVAGMRPKEVTAFIRKTYWPQAPSEAITPIIWRMWNKDGVLENNNGIYSFLVVKQAQSNGVSEHPSGSDSDDLLSKTGTFAFTDARN